MTLSDFLARENLNPAKFAARIGVPPSTVSRLLRRQRKPSLDLMRRISEATGKAVSTLDDFNDEASAKSPPRAKGTAKRGRPRKASEDLRVSLPPSLCEDLGWRPGESLVVVPHGDGALVRRVPKLEELRALFNGADVGGYRDRNDRF